MYDIQLDLDTAIVIRDALNLALERWSGGKPSEQEKLFFLITEFNKMILESYFDAWRLSMERGLGLSGTNNDYSFSFYCKPTQACWTLSHWLPSLSWCCLQRNWLSKGLLAGSSPAVNISLFSPYEDTCLAKPYVQLNTSIAIEDTLLIKPL